MARKPTDWRARYAKAKAPHVVMLHADFAGVKAGNTMLISSPEEIARYAKAIPPGETRTIARMRGDLARRSGAAAMCPVTTSIYLRVVAECALRELEEGRSLGEVAPFWRVMSPTDKVATKLSCGPDHVAHLRALDAAPQNGGLSTPQVHSRMSVQVGARCVSCIPPVTPSYTACRMSEGARDELSRLRETPGRDRRQG